MTFTPYLHFSGNCAEAMAFYRDVFQGGDIMMMRYSESPEAPEAFKTSDRVMHAQFNVPGGMLMASDFPPGMGEPQQAVSVMHISPTVAEAQGLYDRLADGGSPVMPFGPTFWSPGFGMLKDRFGTHWMLTTSQPMPDAS